MIADNFIKTEKQKVLSLYFQWLCQELKNWMKRLKKWKIYQAGIYLLKGNNRNTGTRCEICSNLTMKIPDFFVNFEHISDLVLVFLLLTLNM